MEISGQFLSPIRQIEIQPYEASVRPVVGYAKDYPSGLQTGMHSHPKAQLLFAITGMMQVDTPMFRYLVPPSAGLLLPAHAEHSVLMNGKVALRELFLMEDPCRQTPGRCRVISVSSLLRELILAACTEPPDWEATGRGFHLSQLILEEIAMSRVLPVDLPMPTDNRLRKVTHALRLKPSDNRGLEAWAEIANASSRTLARLFQAETGLSFRQWRQQLRMTEALIALTQGVSLSQAATLAGFAHQSAFGAAFRCQFGVTPGQAKKWNGFERTLSGE